MRPFPESYENPEDPESGYLFVGIRIDAKNCKNYNEELSKNISNFFQKISFEKKEDNSLTLKIISRKELPTWLPKTNFSSVPLNTKRKRKVSTKKEVSNTEQNTTDTPQTPVSNGTVSHSTSPVDGKEKQEENNFFELKTPFTENLPPLPPNDPLPLLTPSTSVSSTPSDNTENDDQSNAKKIKLTDTKGKKNKFKILNFHFFFPIFFFFSFSKIKKIFQKMTNLLSPWYQLKQRVPTLIASSVLLLLESQRKRRNPLSRSI